MVFTFSTVIQESQRNQTLSDYSTVMCTSDELLANIASFVEAYRI